MIKQDVKGQIQQKTKKMVANMKTEREPHLSVANTVDVTKTSDLPCKTGMSEKLNYFDMCSSYKCLSKTYVKPHL